MASYRSKDAANGISYRSGYDFTALRGSGKSASDAKTRREAGRRHVRVLHSMQVPSHRSAKLFKGDHGKQAHRTVAGDARRSRGHLELDLATS